jgi:large subunit ribosomal protein L24
MAYKKAADKSHNGRVHVKTGDTVRVIAGDDKGKTGVVKAVMTDRNRVVVEGVAMVAKHQKPSAANPQGGIIRQEASIHASNVKVEQAAAQAPLRTRKAEANAQ